MENKKSPESPEKSNMTWEILQSQVEDYSKRLHFALQELGIQEESRPAELISTFSKFGILNLPTGEDQKFLA